MLDFPRWRNPSRRHRIGIKCLFQRTFNIKDLSPMSSVSSLRRVLLLLALSVPALAQQQFKTLLVGVDHRTVISLDGPWHYLVDQSPGRALYNDRGEINDNSYGLNTHPNIVGKHNLEYDFATAPTLNVPGDWNTQVPQLFDYEGVLWYERDFDFQPKASTRTFLHIGAANYRSHVWVNGKRICDHEGGYTPFDCEATSVLHSGPNFVVGCSRCYPPGGWHPLGWHRLG